MATVDRQTDLLAPEISSKHLPAVPYRELPEPLSLKKMIGPGVILAAGGIGSGEYVLWPYIAQQTGLGFLWAAVFGSIVMFFIGTECVRYTLATGETAITGFSRVWKGWWLGFVLMALIPNLWPGYATGTATTLTFIIGGGDVVTITVLALLAITLSLTLSPIIYPVLEKLESAMMALMLLFILLAVSLGIRAQAWGELVAGFGSVGRIPEGIPFPVLAGAVAFAGAGGTGILIVSNYVRDKGWGMGVHIPRIISPITGQEEPGSNIGFFFRQDEENLRRWRGWWKNSKQEQFFTFFLFTVATIFIMSVLAYSTVFGQNVGEEFDFIRAEGEVLTETVGSWFGVSFWLAGTLALFSTNLAVWDQVARIAADAMKANWLRANDFWTESKIYFATVVFLFVFSVGVLVSGLTEPLVLLVIVSVLSGITSLVYSITLIQLNRFLLPSLIKMSNARLAVMIVAVVFYGFFAVVTLIDVYGSLTGG